MTLHVWVSITIYYQLYKLTSQVSLVTALIEQDNSFICPLSWTSTSVEMRLNSSYSLISQPLTKEFWISLALSREVNHTCSALWLAVHRWCHTFMCTRSINSGSSLSWQRKLMISFMGPTKLDWSGLVLSTQNLSYNSEFVHLRSWYRPLVELIFKSKYSKVLCCVVFLGLNFNELAKED